MKYSIVSVAALLVAASTAWVVSDWSRLAYDAMPWFASAPSSSAPFMPRRLRPTSRPAYQPALSALCACTTPEESTNATAAIAFLYIGDSFLDEEPAAWRSSKLSAVKRRLG